MSAKALSVARRTDWKPLLSMGTRAGTASREAGPKEPRRLTMRALGGALAVGRDAGQRPGGGDAAGVAGIRHNPGKLRDRELRRIPEAGRQNDSPQPHGLGIAHAQAEPRLWDAQ